MKKTLIALTVAASAVVSGSAMAWTNGNFNGSVDIGGSVTVGDNFAQKWMWATGTALNAFDGNTADLTDTNKKLVVTANKDAAILLGKTESAFAAKNTGSSAIPHIAFTDYKGAPVALNFAGTADGIGSMTLPVTNTAKNTELGNVVINFTAAGIRVVGDANKTSLASLRSENGAQIFNGGLPTSASNAIAHGNAAQAFVGSMGGANGATLLTQVQTAVPGAPAYGISTVPQVENMVRNDGSVVAGAYAMGVKQGQQLQLTFTNEVTQTTAWKAPLNVSVTYQ